MADEIEFEDLSEKVYIRLRNLILDGEIQPGEKLRQEELSARLKVSRTPIVNAITRLSKEVLVEILPRRGARVRRLSNREILDLYDIRIRLEPLGASQAALSSQEEGTTRLEGIHGRFKEAIASEDPGAWKKSDLDFHMEIMRMSGNRLLYDIVENHHLAFVANQRGIILPPEQSIRDHAAMLAAIRARDADAAAEAMRIHLQAARDVWAQTPEETIEGR